MVLLVLEDVSQAPILLIFGWHDTHARKPVTMSSRRPDHPGVELFGGKWHRTALSQARSSTRFGCLRLARPPVPRFYPAGSSASPSRSCSTGWRDRPRFTSTPTPPPAPPLPTLH